MRVDRDAASEVCHHCGAAGDVNSETGTFVCEHDMCPVGQMTRERNAAVWLARWGRSVERDGRSTE
jgi:transposase